MFDNNLCIYLYYKVIKRIKKVPTFLQFGRVIQLRLNLLFRLALRASYFIPASLFQAINSFYKIQYRLWYYGHLRCFFVLQVGAREETCSLKHDYDALIENGTLS